MRIAFLGSSGVIGSAILNEISASHQITKFGKGEHNDKMLDIDRPQDISVSLFQGHEALIHCAGVRDEDFLESACKAYLKGTYASKKLFESAFDAGIRKFVYISSAHVYGSLSGTITELTPCNPVSDYAISHYATERILTRIITKAENEACAIILRPSSVYGMPQKLMSFSRWGLVPYKFPRLAVEDRKIRLLPGSNKIRRNFISTAAIGKHVANFLLSKNAKGLTVKNPIGSCDSTIYDVALMCATAYSEVTQEKCLVEMPENSKDILSEIIMDFKSCDPTQYEGQDIEVYFREIIATLLVLKNQSYGHKK
ncbi:MAG: NAD-dependent epimerase/dehydratase [Alphaproteobacteria bacterium]|nr:NAD-dependent epimerase/dehydratase [Alphaproteobacteria bacterium]